MNQNFYVLLFLLCLNIFYSSSLNLKDDNGRNLDSNKNILNRKVDVSRSDGRRRQKKMLRDGQEESSDSGEESSLEKMKWKEEFQKLWLQKKLEAINTSVPKGDVVNMVAARPWGVPCGDPDQHEMPWGSCMLPMECEAEYRIYRGDYLCGRTQYVCCALQITNYDLYGGFDLSFEGTSLETDTEEKKYENNENDKKKRRQRERKKRRKERAQRKKRIRKVIQRIVREIRKILMRHFRNTTLERKKKTAQLKKFIEMLKQKHLNDRRLVKDVHDQELIKLDHNLQKRLLEVRDMNQQFHKNSTFKDIILNGTLKRGQLRTLMKQYPELDEELDTRRSGADTRDYL